MVFGTANYGEKTPNPACTYFESEYARNAGKKMILLRMIPFESQFQHMQARVMFGMNDLQLGWMEEDPMPEGLVDDIMAALVAEAPAPAPEDDGLSATSSNVSLRPQMSRENDMTASLRRIMEGAELLAGDRELLAGLKKALASS